MKSHPFLIFSMNVTKCTCYLLQCMRTTVKQLKKKQEANCIVRYGMFIEQVESQHPILRVQYKLYSLTNPSPSLIKRICYPESYKFATEAIQWGIDHEDLAKALFSEAITTSHVNLQVHGCGLIIHPSCSYLGESPDSIIVECDCFGRGMLEIKCPYQCKDQSFKNASENSSFCSDYVCYSIPTSFALHSNHSYFYQVQLQMKVCAVYYCYFVVWSPSELAIIKVDYNVSFVEAAVGKALQFFLSLESYRPELVDKWYSIVQGW